METRDNETGNPGNAAAQEGYERQDLQVAGIVYFIVSLVIVTAVCMVGLVGFYHYLDRRDQATQEPVNPLVKNVPEDTRAIPPGYPQTAFPNPRLEVDERNQLTGFLTKQDDVLYSYGWVDEKAGIVRIPIERAMDLLVQRGLPVLPQGDGQSEAAAAKNDQRANAARGAKETKGTRQ
jgi:hypothetical protein